MLADPQTLAPLQPTTGDMYDFDEQPTGWAHIRRDFRWGVQHLTRSVAVVTSRDAHMEHGGVTPTGIVVLSMEPPTLVVRFAGGPSWARYFPRTRTFCVNVLSSRQRTTADAFSQRWGLPTDTFNDGQCSTVH